MPQHTLSQKWFIFPVENGQHWQNPPISGPHTARQTGAWKRRHCGFGCWLRCLRFLGARFDSDRLLLCLKLGVVWKCCNLTGIGKCPILGLYWTSPLNGNYRWDTSWLGDVQWWHLMTHVWMGNMRTSQHVQTIGLWASQHFQTRPGNADEPASPKDWRAGAGGCTPQSQAGYPLVNVYFQ